MVLYIYMEVMNPLLSIYINQAKLKRLMKLLKKPAASGRKYYCCYQKQQKKKTS